MGYHFSIDRYIQVTFVFVSLHQMFSKHKAFLYKAALLVAAEEGHLEIVEYVLKNEADKDTTDTHGVSV